MHPSARLTSLTALIEKFATSVYCGAPRTWAWGHEAGCRGRSRGYPRLRSLSLRPYLTRTRESSSGTILNPSTPLVVDSLIDRWEQLVVISVADPVPFYRIRIKIRGSGWSKLLEPTRSGSNLDCLFWRKKMFLAFLTWFSDCLNSR